MTHDDKDDDDGTVTFDILSRSVKSIKTREILGFIITVSLNLLIFCVSTSTWQCKELSTTDDQR